MKTTLLILSAALACTCKAQWSTDAAAPMIVSNAANEQRHMRAIADADSGYYVFWSDLRNDPQKADLYGQHFDSEGNALWTANGELLLTNPTKSLNHPAPLLMPDGSVIVSYIIGTTNIYGDTVRAMRFDAEANAMWAGSVDLLTGLLYTTVQLVPSDSCAYVVAYCESCGGGGYGCKMQRVRMNGTVQFDPLGQTTGSNYYGPYTIHPDGAGGLLFNIRCGNGAGTCLKAQRFDSLGVPVWDNYMDLADADGLNYGFETAVDGDGVQTAVWEVNGDLRMTRIDTLSAPMWSPSGQIASDLPVHSQQDPSLLAMGGELFVAWGDNRPPASNLDLYIQKYDLATGAELWMADGLPAIQINTYISTTGIIPSDSGAVVVTIDGNIDGYSAMRVRNDGTLAWTEPVNFCVPSLNPFYAARVQLPDGNVGVVAFWQNFGGDVYGGRIHRNGRLHNNVGITEQRNDGQIYAYPNPAQDRITFQLPGQEHTMVVELIDLLGASIVVPAQGNTISMDHLVAGPYIARIHTQRSVLTARFIKL